MAPISEILSIGIRYLLYVFLIRCVLVYGYRIFLHPLHNIPGPFVARFSDWYGAHHAFLRRGHEVTYQNHRKYGSVYRHGPNKLVFNTVQALHDIYQNDRLSKSRAYLATKPHPTISNLFNVLDKRLHRTKRRVIGQGINDKAMREFEPLMLSHIDTFVRSLVKSASSTNLDATEPKVVNMTPAIKSLTLDTITHLAFGSPLSLQTQPQRHPYFLRGLAIANYRTNMYIQFPVIKHFDYIERILYPFMWTSQKTFYRTLREMIGQRAMQGKVEGKKDLYEFVRDVKDPETGEGLGMADVWSEAAFLVPAGGDTTATALAATLHYLSHSPSAYTRLAREIRTTFTSASDIRLGPKLASCSYLRAVIDESMRLTPPTPTTLWREEIPSRIKGEKKEPLVVDGIVVPPGTEIGVSIYAIHHNAEYFPEPFAFRPERWLPGETFSDAKGLKKDEAERQRKLTLEAFTPFSLGPRGCAGKAMAYSETSLVLARLLWCLDFERPGANKNRDAERESMGKVPEFRVKDQFSALTEGPELVFRKRGEAWREMFEDEDRAE
ncbi:cytochrome P450 [Westerdykella ornata]|uniref:Cytochrome P450 n=1 Tax=Westerdykella ornata TaxID=318751 RepID=A0A6A6JBQ5_WESOR|nr:cytochrome P450 [Westerdykella ornata]KAF2273428.1 cytochrome P450 [Westerdykella ornata]